jgi:hypothetical protein
LDKGTARALAEDYCEFLNDKYVDKGFNQEWGPPDVKKRIKYHKKQIKLLESGNYSWREHGDGVR